MNWTNINKMTAKDYTFFKLTALIIEIIQY